MKSADEAIKQFGVLRYLWDSTDFLCELPEQLFPLIEAELKQQVIDFDESKCVGCGSIVDFCECPEAFIEFIEGAV